MGLNIKGACAYLGAYTLACAHTLAAYTLTFLYGTLQERKSIGAEVNWGVRFLCPEDAEHFLVSLSNEVSARLQTAAARGKTITLKVLNLHAVMCENKGLASPCSD
jgi:hypothetical protein